VPPLTPITDPIAQVFEAAAQQHKPVPPDSLFLPEVDDTLSLQMGLLEIDLIRQLGLITNRTSGYRPPAYQSHLYELRTKLIAIKNAIAKDSNQETACAELLAKINKEIDEIHGIARSNGLPTVNKPGTSLHEISPAQAIDLGPKASLQTPSLTTQIELLAVAHGLWRPNCRPKKCDPVHFARLGLSSPQQVSALVQSPVNILMRDPLGRRLGFDPVTGTVINEIGSGTFYSGPDTEPQLIDIGGAVSGTYTVTGVGTGVGPYTLTLTRTDEDGEILETQVITGVASPGQPITTLSTQVLLPVPIDIFPGKFPNTFNPRSHRRIPVAILTTDIFDASTVEPLSLHFGPKGATIHNHKGHLKDVNGDGRLDLVVEFETQETGIQCEDSTASLTGKTVDGELIEGTDSIQCKNPDNDNHDPDHNDDHDRRDEGKNGRRR